ncbi:MAG: hypothetical protein ACRDYY_13240 [Acidimicrobiales bacterium]
MVPYSPRADRWSRGRSLDDSIDKDGDVEHMGAKVIGHGIWAKCHTSSGPQEPELGADLLFLSGSLA